MCLNLCGVTALGNVSVLRRVWCAWRLEPRQREGGGEGWGWKTGSKAPPLRSCNGLRALPLDSVVHRGLPGGVGTGTVLFVVGGGLLPHHRWSRCPSRAHPHRRHRTPRAQGSLRGGGGVTCARHCLEWPRLRDFVCSVVVGIGGGSGCVRGGLRQRGIVRRPCHCQGHTGTGGPSQRSIE